MSTVPDPVEAPAVVMTPELQQALAGLHDLQVVVIGDWPVVPLLVGALLLGLSAGLAALWWRRPRQRYLRRWRRIEIAYRSATASAAADLDAARQMVTELSGLLREVAVDPSKVAPMPPGLVGEAWLRWLDEHAPAKDRGAFVAGAGRGLLCWPYVRAGSNHSDPALAPSQAASLLALGARWLRANA